MRSRVQVTAAVVMAAALLGCSGSSAKRAVDRAEQEIAKIRDQAAKIAPDRLQSLTDSLAAIKTRLEAGDNRSALMSARSVTALARDLGATLENTRTQLETAFKSASDELPGLLQRVQARVAELAAMRRLPPNVNAASFATIRTESAGWTGMWDAAQKAYADGNLAAAMSQANALRRALTAAQGPLGME